MEDFNRLVQMELGVLSRRLRGMAMISRGIVPNLVISQTVVDKVVNAAQGYLQDETGETMVGMVIDTDAAETMPTLYVLDTIQPDESVIRRSTMFEQGDELQQDIFFWLVENWNAYQEIGRDMNNQPIKEEWHVPLKHLGDWHKQPGFMIQPSGGDLGTALRYMDDPENGFEFLLVPIVTLGHPAVTSENGAQVNYFSVDMGDGTTLRMDWWYIHRDVRVFQPISPTIVPADQLPTLTPYPWHILDRELFDEELRLLQDDNKFLLAQNAIFYETDGDLPLEICFIVGIPNRMDVFLVVTDWDYPQSKPRVYLSDFSEVNPQQYVYYVFSELWRRAEPAPEPENFEWNSETSYIVDYIASIEQEMGIRPDDQPMPWERANLSAEHVGASGSISINVEIEDDATGEGHLQDDAAQAAHATDEASGGTVPATEDSDSDDILSADEISSAPTEIISREDAAAVTTLHSASDADSDTDATASAADDAHSNSNNSGTAAAAPDTTDKADKADDADDKSQKQAIPEAEED